MIAEGEPDWLTWASRQADSDEQGPAVFGVESGSWTAEIAARIPDSTRIVIRTHLDASGETYARKIATTLSPRCRVLRQRAETAG